MTKNDAVEIRDISDQLQEVQQETGEQALKDVNKAIMHMEYLYNTYHNPGSFYIICHDLPKDKLNGYIQHANHRFRYIVNFIKEQ